VSVLALYTLPPRQCVWCCGDEKGGQPGGGGGEGGGGGGGGGGEGERERERTRVGTLAPRAPAVVQPHFKIIFYMVYVYLMISILFHKYLSLFL
jgi:hypothetical protein